VQDDLREEYARIGHERDAAGRAHDRQRFWFWVKVAGVCWVWTIIGGAIMANAFHINATVGQFFFPDLMDRAKLWLNAGILVGTGGSFATLVWAWRAADRRGYFD
jgi:hypothetical protein